jgi:hypothetical protein
MGINAGAEPQSSTPRTLFTSRYASASGGRGPLNTRQQLNSQLIRPPGADLTNLVELDQCPLEEFKKEGDEGVCMCSIGHCEHQATNSQNAEQSDFHKELPVRK